MNEIVEEVVKRIQQQQQNTFEVEASTDMFICLVKRLMHYLDRDIN